MCSKFRTPNDCALNPSQMVRVVFAAGHSTSLLVSEDSFASAATSGSAPQTCTPAPPVANFTPVDTPLSSPPPDTGDSTTTFPDPLPSCSTISSPHVPWPAMIAGSSYGGMMVYP